MVEKISYENARYDQNQVVQQAVGQLSLGHNLVLLAKLKEREEILAYAQKAI